VEEYVKAGLAFYKFNLLSKETGIVHAITTRKGGVSAPPFDSLNLGWNVGDAKECVGRNYNVLGRALGLRLDSFVMCKQVHGDRVMEVKKKYEARGHLPPCGDEADAMITNVPGLILMVRIADCIPVLFCDPVQRVVGIAHAGWKGTLKKIAVKTIEVLIGQYNSDPATILVGIGPGIGPCCYEVGGPVRTLYEESFSFGRRLLEERKGKYYLNLWEANRSQLLETGIREEHIEIAGLCSSCNPRNFFSYRREKERTGRFAALIGIEEQVISCFS